MSDSFESMQIKKLQQRVWVLEIILTDKLGLDASEVERIACSSSCGKCGMFNPMIASCAEIDCLCGANSQ